MKRLFRRCDHGSCALSPEGQATVASSAHCSPPCETRSPGPPADPRTSPSRAARS